MSDLAAVLQFLIDHPRVLLLVLGWYLFNAFASSLPKPDEVASLLKDQPAKVLLYRTAFHIMQTMAGNLARIVPQLRLGNGKDKESQP